MHKEKEENGMIHIHHSHSHPSDTAYRSRELGIFENGLQDTDVFLQVNNFLPYLVNSITNHFSPSLHYCFMPSSKVVRFLK